MKTNDETGLSEHEKLKAICDEIGYDLTLTDIMFLDWELDYPRDVREIIFTKSFINTFWWTNL